MATITLKMPLYQHGARGPRVHDVDLDQLTPKAVAVAEAIAATSYRWIRIKSLKPMRDLWAPGHAEQIVGDGSPKLDEPELRRYESWAPFMPERHNIHTVLEREARKMPGWYPVADDGTDLPHSAAARDDDLITRSQVSDLHTQAGVSFDFDGWNRNAPHGRRGFPDAKIRAGQQHVDAHLWSEREVCEFIARRAEIVAAAADLRDARLREADVAARLAGLLRDAVDGGMTEVEAARQSGVDRMTVRSWLGKHSARRDPASPLG